MKRDKLLVGSSISYTPTPPSSLAQLTPNLKELTLHSRCSPHRRLSRGQVEPLARFLFQVPETVETLVLFGKMEDLIKQRTPSTSTSPILPTDDTASLSGSTILMDMNEPPPTGPLAVQKLSLEFFAVSQDNPQWKIFIHSLVSFAHRCVHLKDLSVSIRQDKHQDATMRQIVRCLEEAKPKMLATLSVEEPLEDETLARLLDCAHLAKKGVDTNNIGSMDVVRFQGQQQDFQEHEQEYRQYGWRAVLLHSYTTLGHLSSAALSAQYPTLKSLDVTKCYSCPSRVIAALLTASPSLDTLTTIEDVKSGSDDSEFSYNFIDARHLLERAPTIYNNNHTGEVTGWACTEIRTLKAVISNVPRPDCRRSHYRASLTPVRNGTEGLSGDIETQALKTQREICRQLGRLKQLRVLWLGHESRDFENLENYRVTPDERRQELGLPKKNPRGGGEDDEEEEDEKEDVAMGEEENVGDNEGAGGDGEDEDEGEEGNEDDGDDDEYDFDTDTDKHGKPLMYPLMFLNPRFQYSCLPLSLESGLHLMSELKELVELNVEQMAHRIGLEEVQWMVAHWPRLRKIIGLNIKGEMNEAIEWLKKTRPWIELPESVNSMRQSTWRYYVPPMRGY